MAAGKWIGGILGFMQGGPLGALAGFAIGWLFDSGLDTFSEGESGDEHQRRQGGRNAQYYQQQRQYAEGQRNTFLFSILALASYVIRADGKVMYSEMQTVRNFLRQNFGEVAVKQGEEILLRLFEQQKQMGWQQFSNTIRQACIQISFNMGYSERLQLFNFLVIIAQADGMIVSEEINVLKKIAQHLGLSAADVDSMLNLKDSSTNLEAAYRVLGIAPSATNDEVKKAYRQMALKHHPDRVSTLGNDVKKAAQKKFQEINNAKDLIYKARGM